MASGAAAPAAALPGSPLEWIVGGFAQHTAGNEFVFEVQQDAALLGTPYTVNYAGAGNPAVYEEQAAAYGLSFASVSFSHRSTLAGPLPGRKRPRRAGGSVSGRPAAELLARWHAGNGHRHDLVERHVELWCGVVRRRVVGTSGTTELR